ncbi:response regulator transcription factor [Paenibacillus sp. sgz302251]|uniref:response regulator transcription factor n=1 Tax=Paenibacillus sp. sgz302251 TaxID=3414493 RepID=UPI003C7E5DCD
MKICVVDDESEVRTSIIQKVTALFPHEQVFNAEFGHKALEQISLVLPELVFLDIRMPELSGLEILEILKEKHPAMHVVIISGYDDFEYARKALQHGAADYLLKPADRGQLKEIVEKVRTSLEKRMKNELEQLIIKMPFPYFSTQQMELYNVSLWFDERELKSILIGDRAVLLAPYRDTLEQVMLSFIHESGAEGIVVKATPEQAQSTFREKVGFLPLLAAEFLKRSSKQFFQHADAERRKNRIDRKEWTKQTHGYRQQIIHQARTGDNLELERTLDAWLNMLSHMSYEELKKEASYLMALLDEGLVKNDVIMLDEETLYYWNDWVSKYKTWDELRTRLRKMILGGVMALKETQLQTRDPLEPNMNNWFKQALQLIEASYDINLSLDSVSEAVNVHSVTLSRTFKQQMGVNFVRYMTSKRMKMAKSLLLNTNKKVNEIAEETGYADHAYFRSLFKKEFGYSPSELRKQNGIATATEDAE